MNTPLTVVPLHRFVEALLASVETTPSGVWLPAHQLARAHHQLADQGPDLPLIFEQLAAVYVRLVAAGEQILSLQLHQLLAEAPGLLDESHDVLRRSGALDLKRAAMRNGPALQRAMAAPTTSGARPRSR